MSTIIQSLQQRFTIKDLRAVHYFLGLKVIKGKMGLLLPQTKYIQELLMKTNMADANPVITPSSMNYKFLAIGTTYFDPFFYRNIIGGLQYFCVTNLDISFLMNKVFQYRRASTNDHWMAVKCILHYLRGTVNHGLLIRSSSHFQV